MKKILILAFAAVLTLSMSAQTTKVNTKKAKKEAEKKAAQAAVPAAKVAPAPTPTVVASITKDPSLYLESNTLDYGIINKGAEGTRTFKVSNKGSQPLLLTNCSGSCGCTVPTCPREPILPGKSAQISVKYDTQRPGPINKSVTITSNDPANPTVTVMVKGEVKETAAP